METNKPILVTGATGYLASHIIKQLLETNHLVKGTVRSLINKEKNPFHQFSLLNYLTCHQIYLAFISLDWKHTGSFHHLIL